MIKIFLNPRKSVAKFPHPVVAIGVFDGVHRGHQRLIRGALARARKMHGTAVVVTFFPHPVHVLCRKHDLSLLVSLEHRLKLIEQLGIDVCFVIPFTKTFAKLSAEDFLREYLLRKIGAQEVFIGQNFHFGKNRIGNSSVLRSIASRYLIRTNIIRSVRYKKDVVSSSRLRHLVKQGNLLLARKYLGRDIIVAGQVVRGDQRGRILGIPTANINCGPEILPPLGVYVAYVAIGQRRCKGIVNVGYRPSFTSSQKKNIEVHLLNFHQNIYGQEIEIRFLRKIRNEKKFLSPQDFLNQFYQDKKIAIKFFRTHKHL